MKCYHIHIRGKVQGVGFRPFVYKAALQRNLKGWVNNTHDGVHVKFKATIKAAHEFHQYLKDHAPKLSRVTQTDMEECAIESFQSFEIINSRSDGKPDLLITPDASICTDCREELRDPANRRYQYPFITCTKCGPRYSIISGLPYDRDKTTMDPFLMCNACSDEYNDPMDRRHFSQTNSCPSCKISMDYYSGREPELQRMPEEKIIKQVVKDWESGKIVAIKGIGGYLLTCDACNETAIWNLRQRKLRPAKPFALMYPDLKSLSKDAWLTSQIKEELTSSAAPIVLLPLHKELGNPIVRHLINPGLDKIGAMLPYTPLYQILLDRFAKPIVATSANLTGSPIIYHDDTALRELKRIADVIVINNREIVTPQDDSVISISDVAGKKVIYRRSRGIAPSHFQDGLNWPAKSVLAMGADMKSAFTVLHEGNTFISQYLGNLDSFLSQLSMEATLYHFYKLLSFRPDTVITDLHPNYYSSEFGKKIASNNKIPLVEVQHHKAHFASVLAENELLDSTQKIMGVIWDGVGYGDDKAIWGGEFFTFQEMEMERIFHIPYYDYFMGDKMSTEPRLSALSLLKGHPESSSILGHMFTEQEWTYYERALNEKEQIQTSSMGRLFDGIASMILGIEKIDYEGEAAIKLEQEARKYFMEHKPDHRLTYLHGSPKHFMEQLIDGVVRDLIKHKPAPIVAARFHISLVDLILHLARTSKSEAIAFSGGVFQNLLLIDLIHVLCDGRYDLYFHKELSPNDESVSFGQLAYYHLREMKKESETKVKEMAL